MSPLITLDTRIEVAELELEVIQIEALEATLPSPDDINDWEEQLKTMEENFPQEMEALKTKEEEAKSNCDTAVVVHDYVKAAGFQLERKNHEEAQVALTVTNNNNVHAMEQKIEDGKNKLKRGPDCLEKIILKKQEFEDKRQLVLLNKSGNDWIAEVQSFHLAGEELDKLMVQLNNLASMQQIAAAAAATEAVVEEAIAAGFNVGTNVEVIKPTEGETKGNDVPLFECGTVITISAISGIEVTFKNSDVVCYSVVELKAAVEAAKVKRDAEAAAEYGMAYPMVTACLGSALVHVFLNTSFSEGVIDAKSKAHLHLVLFFIFVGIANGLDLKPKAKAKSKKE